jgi:hypothetical protein
MTDAMPLASNNKGMSLRTTHQRREAVSLNAQKTFSKTLVEIASRCETRLATTIQSFF